MSECEYLSEKSIFKMMHKKGLLGHWKYNRGNAFRVGRRHPDFYNAASKQVIELFGRNYHDPIYGLGHGIRVSEHAEEEPTKADYRQSGWDCLVIWSDFRKETASVAINEFVSGATGNLHRTESLPGIFKPAPEPSPPSRPLQPSPSLAASV